MNLKKTRQILILIIMIFTGLNHISSYAKTAENDSSIQKDILISINKYRTTHGLSPLILNESISIEARKHSQDMANHKMPFGHNQFLTRIKRLHGQIKNSGAAAENVAYNYKDGHDVVKNWLLSPGHKRNIDGNYDLTGIGIARDGKGKLYFTQIFLRSGKAAQKQKQSLPGLLSKMLR
ncbi:MAG TPA: CAP domain-containing protein [Legionella sp.]|nr:CAP domain-containing protein [Legionella sp.]